MMCERRERDNDDDSTTKLLNCLISLAMMGLGAAMAITGFLLFAAWFVLGFFLGPWVKFGTLSELTTTVFLEFAAPSIFFLKGIAQEMGVRNKGFRMQIDTSEGDRIEGDPDPSQSQGDTGRDVDGYQDENKNGDHSHQRYRDFPDGVPSHPDRSAHDFDGSVES